MTYTVRAATRQDNQLILAFIKELAAYEQLADKVVATIEDVNKTLFGPHPKAEVLIIDVNEGPAGFALFFHNYSTFLCRYSPYTIAGAV